MADLPPNNAVPWFLIGKEALRGSSVQALSRRFGVSEERIQRYLDRAVKQDEATGTVRIRTNLEINQASAKARNDLVSILQEAIEELAHSQQPRLSQLPEFEKLLSSAARLFQWPTITSARVMATIAPNPAGYGTIAPNGAPTAAVNLALIATSPEALAVVDAQKPESD